MTDRERDFAKAGVEQLKSAIEGNPGPDDNMARLEVIAKMLMVYPASNATEASGTARAEAYLCSVGGIAPWAVDEAMRRWYRGDCGDYNYTWAPAPATLLEICEQVIQPYKEAKIKLQLLLDAMTMEECMDPRPLPIKDENGNVLLIPRMNRMG